MIALADRWDTVSLTKRINNIPPLPSFLNDEVFKSVANHGVQRILLDSVTQSRAMSPMRRAESPYVVVKKRTYGVQAIEKVPHCKIDILYEPDKEAEFALPGNTMMLQEGESFDPQAYLINEYQETERYYIGTRWEWMMGQLLNYGLFSYLADDGSLNFTLSCNPLGTHVFFEVAARLWSAGTSDPLVQLAEYRNTLMIDSGKNVPLCIMGENAYAAFMAHQAVANYAQALNIKLGDIYNRPTTSTVVEVSNQLLGMRVVEYMGRFEIDGGGGTLAPYIDPDRVILVTDDPLNDTFRKHFVDIHDVVAGNVRTPIFSKIVVDEYHNVEYVRADSAMIPFISSPTSWMSVDVLNLS
jgi:hypothetical protein